MKGAAIKAVGHDPPHQIRVLQPRVQGGPGTAAGPHQKDGTKAQMPDQSGGLPPLVDPELGWKLRHPLRAPAAQKIKQDTVKAGGIEGEQKLKHLGRGGVPVEEQEGRTHTGAGVEAALPLIEKIGQRKAPP